MLRLLDPAAGPLIVKQGRDDGDLGAARSALHNEQRILDRLQGLPGCPRLVRYAPTLPELAVADIGGVTLQASGLLGNLDLQGFLAVSRALAHAVAGIHGRGVIHKDLNPANILVRPSDLRVQIIDYDLATTFAEEHPGFDHPSVLPGTPAYLSPEQTGRMNRPVDYRTDLYSLGATLYALATGSPPFADTDTLGLIHAHLARTPAPPQARAPWLPPRVADLILTLLAKEPDDRYQSAAGLAHDLHLLYSALAADQPLEAVRLKALDLPLAPRPPRRLYGREQESATLMAAFTDATAGSARGLFVAGYSGVGKTVLIHEIHRPVTLGGGLFISGKFELLVALLRQVAAPEHPLVLFLDDLQWADQPSLDFIGALLEDTVLRGLLLIGAYRDNEVDAAHPLRRLLHQPTATGAPARVLTLASLTAGDMTKLLADMLHRPPDSVQPLAAALYAKTSGNPFFTIEFLNALYREGALRPDPQRGCWHWDLDAIAAHPASTNVVDFLADGLRTLGQETADTLVAAACLGNACTLGLMALATGEDAGALAQRLGPALERGILITPNALAVHQAEGGATLAFCHDRMQQAVYQLRDDAWRERLHLEMARRLNGVAADSADPLRAAEHYATAASLIVESAERSLARGLFLAAAVQARQAGAYRTAERFLTLGIGLLAADARQSDQEAAFSLQSELHLVLYSQSCNDEADAVYAVLAPQATSPRQLLAPLCNRTRARPRRTGSGPRAARLRALCLSLVSAAER